MIVPEVEPLYYPDQPTLIESHSDHKGRQFSAVNINSDPPQYEYDVAQATSGQAFTDSSHIASTHPGRIATAQVSSETIPTYYSVRQRRHELNHYHGMLQQFPFKRRP